MSQVMSKLNIIASRLNHKLKLKDKYKHKPGESTSSRPGWMVRDSHLTHGGLRMTNTTAGTFTELKETSPQRVLSPLFPHSRQARMGSPKWRHPLMFVASLSLLSFPFFLAIPTHADSITLSISGNPSITVAPSSTDTFADSGDINISVSNAPASGYTLAIAGGDNTSLTGKTDSTKSITSISSAIDQNTFNTNTSYNNKWGYKPSMHYNTSTEQRATNSNYLPSPTSNADIIDITNDNSSNNYTMSIGARVTSDLGFQTYENNTFVITAVGNSSVLDCDPTKLCVEYEGNGLTYDGEALNRVNYNSTGGTETVTKYSHTSNISDAGVQSGNYPNSANTNEVITIPGASSLHVKITYATESTSYDWAVIWAGNYPSYTAYNNYSSGITCGGQGPKLGNTAKTTVECNISGDTVTFGFRSDGSVNNYGYYAIITGTASTLERSVASGEYATPTSTYPYKFLGWSEDANATTATYVNEEEVKSRLPGDNGDVKTLYAVYKRGLTIKFNPVSDSGTGTGTMDNQIIYSGEPTALSSNTLTPPNNMRFLKWNTQADGSGTSYNDGATYSVPSSTSLGSEQTLYAIWQQGYNITFTKDSNVSSIAVLDSSGATVGTITASGQSLLLYKGDTYTIKPTHTTGYITDAITKISGAGTLSGEEFTVGAGAATINVTSKTLTTFDQAYAAAGKTKYNNYYKIQDMNSTICSNVGSADLGVIGQVIDTRDNEVYKIAKLKDGKCWMLDNLRLDPANSTTLVNITESNTHASATTLNYFKNGGGTTSDKYPTAKINNEAWTSSSQNYYSIPMTINTYKNQTTTSYGAGSGKIGVYYNYCAASAGSYCYGNGTSSGTPSGDATEDLCPKGWRMPAGSYSGEYQALLTAYNNNKTATDPNSFQYNLSTPLSGYVYSGSASGQGAYGSWWSSRGGTFVFYLYVSGGSVNPADYGGHVAGRSLRCIAQ